MELYRIGKIIREERYRKNVSQEELCDSICSVTTLSRIENGSQNPSLRIQQALLERLKYNTGSLVICANGEEIKKYQLECDIQSRLFHREEVDDLLEEYRTLFADRKAEKNLDKQFLTMAEATQAYYTEKWAWEAIYMKLDRALRYTMPNYSEAQAEHIQLLTGVELQILNHMALVHARMDRLQDAVHLLECLVRFLERDQLNMDAPGKYYPMLLSNLGKILEPENRFREIREYSRKGIEYCVRNGSLTYFPDLLFYNGMAGEALGDYKNAEERYEQAFHLYEAMNQKLLAERVRKRISSLNYISFDGNKNFRQTIW